MMHASRVGRTAWPLLLCAASAAVTFACVRMSDSNRERHMVKVTIEHVHVQTEKPFGEVAAALEAHGVDAIIAQGFEAGGHRGMFLSVDLTTQVGTLAGS
jgi:NAD(P)H-dependent flavin oxidoreductase YrpB (nitropropane dioxygenase family)